MVERARHRRARPADAVGELDHRAIFGPGPAERIGQAPVRIRRVDERRVRSRRLRRARPGQLLKRVSAFRSGSAGVSPLSAASAASASRAWASRSARSSSIRASRSSLKVRSRGASAPRRLRRLGDRRVELALRGEAQGHRILGLDVGDVPVAALADRLDGRAGGADQLADLAVGQLGMVADQPGDAVRLVLALGDGRVARPLGAHRLVGLAAAS